MLDVPSKMRRADGSARYAYVTFLLFNLSNQYVSSALLQAFALKRMHTQADTICMITPDAPSDIHHALAVVFDHVIEVPPIFIPHSRRHDRADLPFLFTRFQALRLGADGDLGFAYEKVLILDADVLPLRHYDHLFSLAAPAGIINEDKAHFMDYDENGRYRIPDSVYVDGTWEWHRIYGEICPHGEIIPKTITDRPAQDVENLGIIGALFLLAPSRDLFRAIMEDVYRPEVYPLVSDGYSLPDMQYLTVYFSGQWTSIDLRFCGLSGYPSLDVLYGTHYAGNIKPWSYNKAALKSHRYFPDFQYWYEQLLIMMSAAYPPLQNNNRLRRELVFAQQALRLRV